ncbi:Xaa-Pro dipeptidase [Bacteroidales bacterium Barb4]|nr:Xaa-Pro dipeptidase [Bacteroidales bacterium Barb4]
MQTTIPARLAALRDAMKAKRLDAYIIPSHDPHLSEYPADRWKSREWISGFDGSAGTLVVTKDKAALWTDSRYFLQAERQLEGSGITLFKVSLPDTPTITAYILEELAAGQTAGLDGQTYSAAEARTLDGTLATAGIRLETAFDLIDTVWAGRPPVPACPLFQMPVELSGKSVSQKIEEIIRQLTEAGADCLLLAALDETAWTFNIRGTDIAHNPVAISYGFVSKKETVLFIDPKKIPAEVAADLKSEGVALADYTKIHAYLSRLPKDCKVFADLKKTNVTLFNAIPKSCTIIEGITPVSHLKSIKNETEINGFRNALLKDGIALTKFYLRLEKLLAAGEKVTELTASALLTSLRSEQPGYLMDSFETICGYADHGAIVHYSPAQETDAVLLSESLLLTDSGAQFTDGTTDITRTIALGTPTEQMKQDFTRVLQGMIALADCKFPIGTRGSQLDVLARKPLWDAGLQYLHGTGHGIGHCLNVHEGPQSIRMEDNPVPLKPGMILSNEPGIYRTGQYGIRTENMMLVREDGETPCGTFLSFETLTLCPIDTRLIAASMLSPAECLWLDNYHQTVYGKLSPHLNEEEKEWLKEKTKRLMIN